MKFVFCFTFLLLNFSNTFSRDPKWWNDKHQWDGITPWYEYITNSPKYMGPNALPVPDIKNGTIPENAELNVAFDYHTSKHDNTKNLYTDVFFPLFHKRVGLKLNYVPIEYYETDTIIRDIRKARNYDAKGYSLGDVYIATYVQLIENHNKLPDVLLTINLKTASGTKLEDARHTDTPGYFFDLSFGKKYSFTEKRVKYIKPYIMAGLYIWQINGYGQMQNDAFLYGAGFDLGFNKLELTNALGGYIGYIGNGDKPMVYRLTLKSTFSKKINYLFRFQQGLHDFEYTSFRFGLNFSLKKD